MKMPQYYRQYALVVAALLLANFALVPPLITGTLHSRPLPLSFAARCGEGLAVLLIACGFAYMQTRLISAAWLFYTAHRRGPGHALNPITRVYAADDLITGLVYLASALGLGRLSCWWPVALFGAATAAASVKAIWVTKDTPLLARMPDGYVEAQKVNELQSRLAVRIAQLQDRPGASTVAADESAADLLIECKSTLTAMQRVLMQSEGKAA